VSSRNLGTLTSQEPSGPVQACNGSALCLLLPCIFTACRGTPLPFSSVIWDVMLWSLEEMYEFQRNILFMCSTLRMEMTDSF
jgi:hypothetical protein